MTKKVPTHFDLGSAIKDVHDENVQALRVVDANREVPTEYSSVDLTYNIDGSVTQAIFWRGKKFQVTRINTVADVAGSLNNKYFFINSGNDSYPMYVWYSADNTGVDPAIPGKVGIQIPYSTGDSAAAIAAMTQGVLGRLDHFTVERNSQILIITNLQEGVTTNASAQTTGFTIGTDVEGTSDRVKTVLLPYTNGVKYVYNVIERKFELVNGTFTGSITGEVSTSGLKNAGRVTEVEINDATWTALPTTPLTDRNAMSIQNPSGVEIKLNYSNAIVGYVGMPMRENAERFYDIKGTIVIYAKSAPGTGTVTLNIEELS